MSMLGSIGQTTVIWATAIPSTPPITPGLPGIGSRDCGGRGTQEVRGEDYSHFRRDFGVIESASARQVLSRTTAGRSLATPLARPRAWPHPGRARARARSGRISRPCFWQEDNPARAFECDA